MFEVIPVVKVLVKFIKVSAYLEAVTSYKTSVSYCSEVYWCLKCK